MDPFTFKLPGHNPDALLNVFGKKIHAHSRILKLHSTYFRKFMYAPNGPPDDGKYKYITVIDEDGYWGLEKVSVSTSAVILYSLVNFAN